MHVAVCLLTKISLHMHRPKTMFARLTQSQAISQSFSRFHHFEINERYEQVSLFFHIAKLFFVQNYRFLYHGDQKISCMVENLQVAGFQLRKPPV